MPLPLLLILILSLGIVAGLRSMTAPAVVCWASHFGWLSLSHSPLNFLTYRVSLVIFTLLALGEFIGDKLPNTPSRTSLFPLIARAVFGALAGAALVITAGASLAAGIVFGAAGAILGSFLGFFLRRTLTRSVGLPDLPVALLEDLVAVGAGLFVASRF